MSSSVGKVKSIMFESLPEKEEKRGLEIQRRLEDVHVKGTNLLLLFSLGHRLGRCLLQSSPRCTS